MKEILLIIFVCFFQAKLWATQEFDGWLVKFEPNLSRAEMHDAEMMLYEMGFEVEKRFTIVPNLVKLTNKNLHAPVDEFHFLNSQAYVEYVSPNYIRRPLLADTHGYVMDEVRTRPDIMPKPELPSEWIKDPKYYWNYGISQNATSKVHKKYEQVGNPNVVIAILDSGVDYNHPDLIFNMWRNKGEMGLDANGNPKETNGIDDDGNGYVDDVVGYDFAGKNSLPYDDNSHGTHVAGLAAATGGNGIGSLGQCPRCSIMALKFITKEGYGTDADAIEGLEYAMKMKADIINSSWGANVYSKPLFEAFEATSKAGIINVVAAGNDGIELGVDLGSMYPAQFIIPGLYTIAAIYETNIYIPMWSNRGRRYVHLSNGGVQISSTVPNGKWMPFSGTSMASPGVAGCMGLIKSEKPNISFEELSQLFESGVYADRSSMQGTYYRGRPAMDKIFKKLRAP